jgi:hypothetical protein
MTDEPANAEINNQVADKKNPVSSTAKKKPSWLHTILWMFSMLLLVNVVMGVIAYFLFFHNK